MRKASGSLFGLAYGDACLAGSFAGARLGLDAWPAAWRSRIEHPDRIARPGEAWD